MASFNIPLSGLKADSTWLNVISNNLANLNTTGFKEQSVNFGDLYYQLQGTSGDGNPIQVGTGVDIASTVSDFSNGSLNATGVSSNMALQGNGFFAVSNASGLISYTRAGDFTTNSQGQLVTPQGELVMGYPAVNGVVSTTGALAPISVDSEGTIPGSATTTFETNTNLNSNAAVGATFSTPITIYDSIGTPQQLTITYTNNGPSSWGYAITLPASATGGATPTTVSTGTLQFDTNGNLTSPTGSVTGINITGLADGAAPMNLTWNLTTASGGSAITRLDAASSTSSITQDGFGVGSLTGFTVAANGTLEGQFSNNQTKALGQIAVASFGNQQGLEQTTNGDYVPTFASGTAVMGQAGVAGNGTIDDGSLEASNVNLSAEFANMIVAQQGYEANAKALTTFNQISQSTIQLIT